MKNRILAIFGIVTWIFSVISSTEDIAGNFADPATLIVVSVLANLIFMIMAVIRLWRQQRVTAVLFLVLFFVSFVYVSVPIQIINFILFTWVILLLWVTGKHEGLAKTLQKKSGLTDEEFSSVQRELEKGNHKAAVQKISEVQERYKKIFKETTGIDIKDIILEIGKEISWTDIINHAFRVLYFDRSGTIVNKDNEVKVKSTFQPYGYLLVESPILNNRATLPIIHRDDFLLAASVFDEPKLADLVDREELLVTYAPKHLGPKGLSASSRHVLHYAIVPSGTLDSYYSVNNDTHMAKPEPQKLFGPFVYYGEIKVQINPVPTF